MQVVTEITLFWESFVYMTLQLNIALACPFYVFTLDKNKMAKTDIT